MSNHKSENIYGLMYKTERNARIRSGASKEERAEMYEDSMHRTSALKALSKWSPIRFKKFETQSIKIVLTNMETNEQTVEAFNDLSLEHAKELAMVMADKLARKYETAFSYYIDGIGNSFPEISREYVKDEYSFKAVSEKDIIEGKVKAYNLKEATKLVFNQLQKEESEGKSIYQIEVSNPYTTKNVLV